ncbi:hypothetical protein EON83_09720 [bacterium]|nr:MAG: hypothetical protein EON83_09720 [bacterium]
MAALLVSVFVYALVLRVVWFVESDRVRKVLAAWLLPVSLVVMLVVGGLLWPVEKLIVSTLLLLGLVKCAVALRRSRADVRSFSTLGLGLYFFAWPGANMAPFKTRVAPAEDETVRRPLARALFIGATCAVVGIASLLTLGWFATSLSSLFLGWATIFALLMTVHFGIGEMLPWAVHQLGFRVGPLFRAPLASESLIDFWSRRWNISFVEMNSLLFLRPLRKRFGAGGAIFGTFLLSGLFHEIALSYPAGGGWGGPMLYFLLHGALCVLVVPRLNGVANRVLAWAAILGPLPLLFHEPVRATLIIPLDYQLSELLHQRPFEWWFSLCLWLGSIGHFCILGASFQVPKRLGWNEDLPKLSRFNRKVFWTYGAFIVLCIVSFGIMSALLHGELLRGDKAAVTISIFIGVFWAARVGTDLFYFKHDDWPRGWEFEVGHVALTFLFGCLSVLFGLVVPLHVLWQFTQVR